MNSIEILNRYMDIDDQLRDRRAVAIDPDTGNNSRRRAWERIDELLDERNELGKVAIDAS